jgi:hypothetical protein
MKRLIAVAALGAAPLLAVATPAGAAPPQHYVFSGCNVEEDGFRVCYNLDGTVMQTVTSSGNEIAHSSGTNTYTVTNPDGSGYTEVYAYNSKFVYQQGQPHVSRAQTTDTFTVGDRFCTLATYYKFTNGIPQVDDTELTCNF